MKHLFTEIKLRKSDSLQFQNNICVYYNFVIHIRHEAVYVLKTNVTAKKMDICKHIVLWQNLWVLHRLETYENCNERCKYHLINSVVYDELAGFPQKRFPLMEDKIDR